MKPVIICPIPECLGDRSIARLEWSDGTTRIVTRAEVEREYPELIAAMQPHRRAS